MLRKLFAALVLTAIAATPALAHPQKMKIINNTTTWQPILEITGIIFTPNGALIPLPDVYPGKSAIFNFVKDPPCLRTITIVLEDEPPWVVPNKINVCTQNTITVRQDTAGRRVVDYGFTPLK